MASIGSKKINKNDIIYIITWKKWQLSQFFFSFDTNLTFGRQADPKN